MLLYKKSVTSINFPYFKYKVVPSKKTKKQTNKQTSNVRLVYLLHLSVLLRFIGELKIKKEFIPLTEILPELILSKSY